MGGLGLNAYQGNKAKDSLIAERPGRGKGFSHPDRKGQAPDTHGEGDGPA